MPQSEVESLIVNRWESSSQEMAVERSGGGSRALCSQEVRVGVNFFMGHWLLLVLALS